MVSGPLGAVGADVTRPVMVEPVSGGDDVRDRLHNIMGDSVLDMALTMKNATRNRVM